MIGTLLLAAAVAPGPAPVASTELSEPTEPSELTVTVERRLHLMGTSLTVEVEASSRPAALAASEAALAALEQAERRLSTWRDDSELARLNRAPVGEPFPLSAELAAELAAAERCARATGGAFDPTVGALVSAWDLRGGGHEPAAEELRRALAATGARSLELTGRTAVRRLPELAVEEGGFGKGAGLAAALGALAAAGAERASLDLGGQVAVLGGGTVWEVRLADPRDRRRPVVAVALEEGSLATSGTSERGGHILDPRSGAPARDFGSLTVWAPDPLLADCLSTGLYVMGPEAALAWAAAHPGVEVLALLPRPGRIEVRASAGLARRLAPLAEGVELSNDSDLSDLRLDLSVSELLERNGGDRPEAVP